MKLVIQLQSFFYAKKNEFGTDFVEKVVLLEDAGKTACAKNVRLFAFKNIFFVKIDEFFEGAGVAIEKS